MADHHQNISNDSSVPLYLSELVVLVSSEMIVNLILKESSQPKKHTQFPTTVSHNEMKAREMQFALLLVLLASYYLFFQAPYLIGIGLCLVLLRLAFLRCYWVRNKNTSKTLRYLGSSHVDGGTFTVPFKPGISMSQYQSNASNQHHTSLPTVTNTSYATTPPKPQVPVSPLYDTPPNTSLTPPARSIKTRVPVATHSWSMPRPITRGFLHTTSPVSSPLRNNSAATPSPMTTPLSPPGIYNTGNICFLISSIHCLSSVEGFASMLRTSEHKYRLLTDSLIQIIKHTQDWSRDYINPAPFLHSVSTMNPHLVEPKGRGTHQTQQDAGEFMLWLLDNLHSAYKHEQVDEDEDKLHKLTAAKDELVDQIKDIDSRHPSCYSLFREVSSIDLEILSICDMSEVYKLFCGQVLEARECQECMKMSINLEYHTILPLPVPYSNTSLSLVDCFNLFGEVENLSNEQNMLMCSYCSQNMAGVGGVLTHGKRLSVFTTLPNRLIIQLMRYSFNNVQQKASKKCCPINFPLTDLDLSPFTMETKMTRPTDPCLYNLTGFCVHVGAQSTSYGHYIAYSKVKDGSWYQFNDHHVTQVRDIRSEIKSAFVSQNAYLLFYTRR